MEFENDFEEGGFSKWGGPILSAGASASVENLNPHHGTYNARFNTVGNANVAYVYGGFVATPVVYFRSYVKFTAMPAVGDGVLFNSLEGGANYTSAILADDGGGPKLGVFNFQGGVTTYTLGPNAAINTWYCVEVMRAVGTNIQTVWIDGVATTRNDVITGSTVYAYAGVRYQDGAGLYTMYLDCCVISASRIACEVVGEPIIYPTETVEVTTTSVVALCGTRVRTLRHTTAISPWIA